jgi:hypothetical protein
MKRSSIALLSVMACGVLLAAQMKPARPLEIYVIDVEGGKSDLWLTPAGQSILIDTGSPGDRDLGRIMDTIRAAGVTRLDYLITTHYHVDHAGNLAELVKQIPVERFVDHGVTVEGPVVPGQREQIPGFWELYPSIYAKGTRISVKPGDRLPITGLDWRIVTSGGKVIKTPLPGAGKSNPLCAGTERRTVTLDPDDGASIGSVISYGKFRTLDFGDMTWDIEHDLMCPNNPIGTVDLYFVSDHGLPDNSSKEFVHAIQPRTAIVQNSARKGNSLVVLEVLRTSPGFEDLWQLHWGTAAGVEWNSPGVFIANGTDPTDVATALTAPPGRAGASSGGAGTPPNPAAVPASPAPAVAPPPTAAPAAGVQTATGSGRGRGPAQPPHSPAYAIKVTVQADGTYTVTNMRNNFSKTYAPRVR